MGYVFEIFTDIMLDLAMLAMVLNLVVKKAHGDIAERFVTAGMGLGFLVCCISKGLSGSGYMLLTLTALGFMLSYTAFVFTFSRE